MGSDVGEELEKLKVEIGRREKDFRLFAIEHELGALAPEQWEKPVLTEYRTIVHGLLKAYRKFYEIINKGLSVEAE